LVPRLHSNLHRLALASVVQYTKPLRMERPMSELVVLVVLVLHFLFRAAKHSMLLLRRQSALKLLFNTMQPMLRVTSSIRTQKSSAAQLLLVCKLTPKTLLCASCNHHQSHHRAQSSSEKCAHRSHHRHHHSVSVNKLLLFRHHLHLFSASDHLNHRLSSPRKPSFAVWLLFRFLRDQSSSSVCHLSHRSLVTSSSNVGFHTDLHHDDARFSNVPDQLCNMLVLVM
jgi:hypothetical protein